MGVPGSRDQISKFWDPFITFEPIEIPASNLADIHHGPLLRPDHETTPKWAWPRSIDHISKFNFGTPLINFERIEISASNLTHT